MAKPNPRAELGQGGRFAALKGKLAKREGVEDPGALSAWIGKRKYGAKKMRRWAAKGRKQG